MELPLGRFHPTQASQCATAHVPLPRSENSHASHGNNQWCNLHHMPKLATMVYIFALATSMACSAFTAEKDDPDQQVQLPTPD